MNELRNRGVEDILLAAVIFGEAAGLISDIPGAGEIVERMVAEAVALLRGAKRFLA